MIKTQKDYISKTFKNSHAFTHKAKEENNKPFLANMTVKLYLQPKVGNSMDGGEKTKEKHTLHTHCDTSTIQIRIYQFLDAS